MATLEVRTREAGEFIVISCTNAGPELQGNALERAEPGMFLVRREFWLAKNRSRTLLAFKEAYRNAQ